MNIYAIFLFTIIMSVVVILFMFKSSNDGKDEILDEMWENNDIDEKIYKKYRFRK